MKRWVATMIAAACLPAATLAAGFPADRIVSVASGDWNGDGAQDLAVVARPADDSIEDNGLYLYFANPDENRLMLALALPESVWGNLTLYGQEPELTALPNGSFTLLTKNEAVGRERWRQTLTIAYRNNDFIVAGYTFTSYDTLGGEADRRECDLNVLTGKGKRDGKPISGKPAFLLLKKWDDATGSTLCGFDQ